MDVHLNARTLKNMVARAAWIADKKSTIPILAGVRLVANGSGQLTVEATDLETYLTQTVDAKALREGSALPASAYLFQKLLASSPQDGEIHIRVLEEEGAWVKVQADAGQETKLVGFTSADWPVFPQLDSDPVATVAAGDLARLIRKTRYAISPKESRYTLNGLQLAIRAERIQFVATDGHRLVQVSAVAATNSEQTLLAPRVPLTLLARLLHKLGGPIEIRVGETLAGDAMVSFRGGNWTLATRTLTGTFPKYDDILNQEKDCNIVAVAERDAFLQAVKFILPMIDACDHAVKLTFANDKLILRSTCVEKGEGRTELAVNYKRDVEFSIDFNAHYLLEYLEAVLDGPIHMAFHDGTKTAFFHALAEAESDPAECMALMPMRI